MKILDRMYDCIELAHDWMMDMFFRYVMPLGFCLMFLMIALALFIPVYRSL